jgi:hypothetical protein
MNVFKELNLQPKFKKSINATFISLKLGLWILISLEGGVSKIISTVLANMLKTVLEKVISKSQNVSLYRF